MVFTHKLIKICSYSLSSVKKKSLKNRITLLKFDKCHPTPDDISVYVH